MKLTQDELKRIQQHLDDSGITITTLKHDLFDHLVCVVEAESRSGKTFELALREALHELAPHGLYEIQQETVFLLNHVKIIRMKKTMYIIGLLSSVSIGVGWLFSLLHWPGGGELFNYGFLGFLLLFIPMLSMDRYKKSIRKALPEKFKVLLGIVSALIVGGALALKVLHMPGADILLIVGMLTFIFGFLPFLFFTMYRKSVGRSEYVDQER